MKSGLIATLAAAVVVSLFGARNCAAAPWSLSVVNSKGSAVAADIDIGRTDLPPLRLRTDATDVLDGDLVEQSGGVIGNVVVVANGLAVGGGTLRTGENRVVLGAPHSVSGRVVDSFDNPLANIIVSVYGLTSDAVSDGETPSMADSVDIALTPMQRKLFSALTDADGHYVLTGLPNVGSATICVDDPKWRQALSVVDLYNNGEVPDLKTIRAAWVHGHVLQSDGRPAAHRIVRALDERQNVVQEAQAEADGSYLVGGLPPGHIYIEVEPSPTNALEVAPRLALLAAAAGLEAPDIHMLVGTPVEVSTEPAVAGGLIRFDGFSMGAAGASVETGAGSVMANLAPGQYSVRYRPRTTSFLGPRPPNDYLIVEVRAGQANKVVMPLTPALTALGTAHDAAGQPVAGAIFGYDDGKLATTGPDGRFEWHDLAPGKIELIDSASWDVMGSHIVVMPSAQPLDIVLRPTARAARPGRVIDEMGRPVAGALVTSNRPPIYAVDNGRLLVIPSSGRHGRSAADGTFAIDDARVADAMLRAARPGYCFLYSIDAGHNRGVLSANGVMFDLTKPSYRAGDFLMLRLTRQVSGRVLGSDGKPVGGALVAALVSNFDQQGTLSRNMAHTDKYGRFKLTGLPDGDIGFAAGKDDEYGETHSAGTALGDLVLRRLPRAHRDLARGEKMIEDFNAAATADDVREWNRELPFFLAPYDIQGALDLAKTHSLNGAVAPMLLTGIATSWIVHNRDAARRELPGLLPHIEAMALSGAAMPRDDKPRQTAAAVVIGIGEGPPPSSSLDTLGASDLMGDDGFLNLLSATADLLPHPNLTRVTGEPAGTAWLRDWVRKGFATRRRQLASFNVATARDTVSACRFADLAALAARLGDPSALEYATSALQIGMRAAADGNDSQANYYGRTNQVVARIARGGLALVQAVLPLVPSGQRAYSVDRAATVLCRFDMPATLQLLNGGPPTGRLQTNGWSTTDEDGVYVQTAEFVLSHMQPADAPAALKLARKIPPMYGNSIALALAARLQKPAVAVGLFHESLDALPRYEAPLAPRIVHIAFDADPVLGRELVDSMVNKAFDPFDLGNPRELPADFLAHTAPGLARVWLEWRWRQAGYRDKPRVAQQMSMIDSARAFEMLPSLEFNSNYDGQSDSGAHFEDEAQIAMYLMAPEDVRRRIDPSVGYPFVGRWTLGEDDDR